jgi:hypothetical protein
MADDPPGCFACMHRELVSGALHERWVLGTPVLWAWMHDGAHAGDIAPSANGAAYIDTILGREA